MNTTLLGYCKNLTPGVHLAGASWRQLAQKYLNYVLAQNNLRLACTVVAQPTKHNFTPLIYTKRHHALIKTYSPTGADQVESQHKEAQCTKSTPKSRVAKMRRRRRTIT